MNEQYGDEDRLPQRAFVGLGCRPGYMQNACSDCTYINVLHSWGRNNQEIEALEQVLCIRRLCQRVGNTSTAPVLTLMHSGRHSLTPFSSTTIWSYTACMRHKISAYLYVVAERNKNIKRMPSVDAQLGLMVVKSAPPCLRTPAMETRCMTLRLEYDGMPALRLHNRMCLEVSRSTYHAC